MVTLEDGVAAAVEVERHAVSGDRGVASAEIAESISGFDWE